MLFALPLEGLGPKKPLFKAGVPFLSALAGFGCAAWELLAPAVYKDGFQLHCHSVVQAPAVTGLFVIQLSAV